MTTKVIRQTKSWPRVNWRAYAAALKSMGFRKEWETRGGGIRTIQYRRVANDRTISVQLWEDGKHRATHGINGCEMTTPSGFRSIYGMRKSVMREAARTDNRYAGRS